MARIQLTELTAFSAVAEHRSFTRAAAQVGIALPTMSQTIRALEERLGVRLFNRTTRNVAVTEAGKRLLAEVQPILDSIDHALESVNSFRDTPMGTLRVVVSRSASATLRATTTAPSIEPFLAEYPAIRIEVTVRDSLGDIVGGQFDAGIGFGHQIERDMVIQRMMGEFRLLAVAAPNYLARHGRPSVPNDLHAHNCIRYRFPGDDSLPRWKFREGERKIEVAVEGSYISNDLDGLLRIALEGGGIAIMPEPIVASRIAEGRLVPLLEDWSDTIPGIFLYYPSRRQTPMPLKLFLGYIRKRKVPLVEPTFTHVYGGPTRPRTSTADKPKEQRQERGSRVNRNHRGKHGNSGSG